MIIYKVTNLINGKVYIGQTQKTLKIRKIKHIYESFEGNSKLLFHKALRKYGEDSFSWDIIDYADSQDELNKKEIYWISHYNSFGENGYNLTNGGASGGNIKFTVNDVLQIKEMIKKRIPIIDIANKYNVDREVITRLKSGRHWSNVGEDVSYIKYPKRTSNKLTENYVREIKIFLKEDKLTQREISEMFNVTPSTIGNIRTGKVWGDIGEDLSHVKLKNKKEKLTEDKIIEIKHLLKENKNLTQEEIGRIYGVSKSVINSIRKGKTWKCIGEDISNEKIIRKLTEEEVIEIKYLLKDGTLSQQKIANKFNVSQGTIWRINAGEIWKDVKIN